VPVKGGGEHERKNPHWALLKKANLQWSKGGKEKIQRKDEELRKRHLPGKGTP